MHGYFYRSYILMKGGLPKLEDTRLPELPKGGMLISLSKTFPLIMLYAFLAAPWTHSDRIQILKMHTIPKSALTMSHPVI